MKKLKFQIFFTKLQNNRFTTIRKREHRIDIGDKVEVYVDNSYLFDAICKSKYQKQFSLINRKFLQKDIHLLKKDPYQLFCSFYPDFKKDDFVTIFIFEKVKSL